MRLVRGLGAAALKGLRRMGRMALFLLRSVLYTFSTPLKVSRVLKQIRFIGFQSILVILLTGAFTGMVLGLQGYYTLSRFGSEAFLGPMVALAVIRELGPVITGLMVTARAGSALTAEIGIMRNTEQIDALELMGLNPLRYLVIPNLVAAVISLPLLTSIFDVIGIVGGFLIGGSLLGVGEGTYFGEIANHVRLKDIWVGIDKSVIFGVLIAWVCCYKGYFTRSGAEGVSRATTQAVVMSSVLILIWDYFMTSVLL